MKQFILLFQFVLEPNETEVECLEESLLCSLTEYLVLVLGIDNLNDDVVGKILAVYLLVRHYLEDKYALALHIAVANGVSLANERQALIFKVFSAYYLFYFCHIYISPFVVLVLILYSISRKSQKVNIFFTKHKQRRFLTRNDKEINKKRAAEQPVGMINTLV